MASIKTYFFMIYYNSFNLRAFKICIIFSFIGYLFDTLLAFSEVFVMVKDDQVRNSRLRLIKRLEYLIGQLADVSEIVPEEELPA